ncbi:MAG: Heavy metal-translocating ATPase [Microgenomates group bacterium GW2011_GWA2_46_7]|nr:MAG: Heavy metal-translocating ATPase [Microgenomates group bacterium GW2011_GWA2_46_7]KKU46765.1 MAG: Heavy metal-translocating ATPase [Microgenomates group bacterium GW2011_GWC2_46_7]
MFNFLNKKPTGSTITLQLNGLHCSSCSLNIDGELEEMKGVISSNTSYARQEAIITYDPAVVDPSSFRTVIQGLGYKIVE